MHSSIATLGHIEAQIPEGLAFTYQQGIVVIVNLSFKHSVSSDVISSLAIILREGLFKMGVSSEFRDFLLIPQGYIQAVSALRLGKKSQSMAGAIILMLIFWNICFPRSAIRSVPSFWSLHGWMHCRIMTEKTILSCVTHSRSIWSMNAILFRQPVSFFIHRSSLTYRLERIQKLTKIDLDNPKDRLLLQLCFLLQEKDQTVT